MLDLVHLKKDCTDVSVYRQLFMEIRDGNYGAFAPLNTVISMRLPDSTSTFTAEVWAIKLELQLHPNI